MKIAEIMGMDIEVPENVWYSFFNSPYTVHREGAALDIYYPGMALFPFENGRVVEIRELQSHDHLIIFEVNDYCLKMLHVKPDIEVGERVYAGDEIGTLQQSPYFKPWSDRHAHIDGREQNILNYTERTTICGIHYINLRRYEFR